MKKFLKALLVPFGIIVYLIGELFYEIFMWGGYFIMNLVDWTDELGSIGYESVEKIKKWFSSRDQKL